MRTETEIKELLDRISEDSRATKDVGGNREVANTWSNAPLALQQQAMEAAYYVLLWVLEEHEHPGLGLENDK